MKRVKEGGNSRRSGGQVDRRATMTRFAPTRRELLKLGAVTGLKSSHGNRDCDGASLHCSLSVQPTRASMRGG